MHRDPRDIALSMWQAHFSGRALAYSYDLKAMAHRFNLFARLQAQWQDLFPSQILRLNYEELVGDVEHHSHRIAEFIDVDWCPEMAEPGQATSPILSLSAGQVRQKVHKRSVGRWAQYADMLAPFIEDLDAELWPELVYDPITSDRPCGPDRSALPSSTFLSGSHCADCDRPPRAALLAGGSIPG